MTDIVAFFREKTTPGQVRSIFRTRCAHLSYHGYHGDGHRRLLERAGRRMGQEHVV